MGKYGGPERRCEKPGRRARDFETCMFHDGTCKNIEEIWKALKAKAPIWVLGVLVTIAIFVGYGAHQMMRDTNATVKEIARDLDKVERQQAVVLHHLKIKAD